MTPMRWPGVPMTGVLAQADRAFPGAPAAILQNLRGQSGSERNTGDTERLRVQANPRPTEVSGPPILAANGVIYPVNQTLRP